MILNGEHHQNTSSSCWNWVTQFFKNETDYKINENKNELTPLLNQTDNKPVNKRVLFFGTILTLLSAGVFCTTAYYMNSTDDNDPDVIKNLRKHHMLLLLFIPAAIALMVASTWVICRSNLKFFEDNFESPTESPDYLFQISSQVFN